MAIDIERYLKGTRRRAILQELFTNSIHFPLANIFLELLIEGPLDYIKEPDLYTIMLACLIQAYFLGSWQYAGKSNRLLGNLIAPAIYTAMEFSLEGTSFFISAHHLAYWGFSLAIGLFQELGAGRVGLRADVCTILEHFTRTCILLVMYGLFEATTEPEYNSLALFFANDSHVFVAIVIGLLGLVVGFTNLTTNRYLLLLQNTSAQLRRFSEWLLGRELLSAAIGDASSLVLKRKERAVLFIDIRGFTRWSEDRMPELVVNMLNDYFETAEKVWRHSDVIKIKYTADEIMAIFPGVEGAVRCALQIKTAVGPLLRSYKLSAGMGIHRGLVVEGLIGSTDVKMYDVIGDTVNTAKRICDMAESGEILVSDSVRQGLPGDIGFGEPRGLTVKGKSEPIRVYPLT